VEGVVRGGLGRASPRGGTAVLHLLFANLPFFPLFLAYTLRQLILTSINTTNRRKFRGLFPETDSFRSAETTCATDQGDAKLNISFTRPPNKGLPTLPTSFLPFSLQSIVLYYPHAHSPALSNDGGKKGDCKMKVADWKSGA
jgi:hypothetical protein